MSKHKASRSPYRICDVAARFGRDVGGWLARDLARLIA